MGLTLRLLVAVVEIALVSGKLEKFKPNILMTN
jgi:hypothetical protein